MESHAEFFRIVFDLVTVSAAVALGVLGILLIRDWHQTRRKQAQPKVISLSRQFQTRRPNERMVGSARSKL